MTTTVPFEELKERLVVIADLGNNPLSFITSAEEAGDISAKTAGRLRAWWIDLQQRMIHG